jgi:hypothetical protein
MRNNNPFAFDRFDHDVINAQEDALVDYARNAREHTILDWDLDEFPSTPDELHRDAPSERQ